MQLCFLHNRCVTCVFGILEAQRGSRTGFNALKCIYFFNTLPHTIHVWYIYLHLVDFYGKCREIYHTWMLWVQESIVPSNRNTRPS